MNIVIDKEFQSLIPALTTDEYRGLEESILSEGCRDALVLWGDTLIDGHNRYSICKKYDIPFKTVQKEFISRDDVLLWMIDTQFSRRNLSAPDRILLAQKKAPILERMAKKRISETTAKSNVKRALKTENLSFIQMDKPEIKIAEQPKTAVPEKPKAVEQPKPVIEKKPEPPKPIHTQKEVAKIAGVSSGAVQRPSLKSVNMP